MSERKRRTIYVNRKVYFFALLLLSSLSGSQTAHGPRRTRLRIQPGPVQGSYLWARVISPSTAHPSRSIRTSPS